MKIETKPGLLNTGRVVFQGKISKKKHATLYLLDPKDKFLVADKPNNQCCLFQKYEPLLLSPYDVAVMRKTCNLTSSEFFAKYATLSNENAFEFPWAALNTGNKKSQEAKCPFQRSESESVYDGRPLACRLNPLGRISENYGSSHFVALQNPNGISQKNLKKYSLDSWIKYIKAENFISEVEFFESVLNELQNPKYGEFTPREKMTIASILYTPDAFASDDLFSYYLRKPEFALEALQFGYSRVKSMLLARTKVEKR